MLAELTGLETAGIICSMIFGFVGMAAAAVALFKKQGTEISPQPLSVEIAKSLHDQFAGKEEFDALKSNNTARHNQIFNEISRVEREAREHTESAAEKINADRAKTMEKLTGELGFIRESIVAITTELRLSRERK